MKKAKVYAAFANGTWTEIKAHKKENALRRFQQIDPAVSLKDVTTTASTNSQQAPVEDLYPEICQ